MRRLLIGAGALALLLAGCDSAGGPLHRADISAERILSAAVPGLLPRAAPEPGASVDVVDHLDPRMIERRTDLPEEISELLESGSAAEPEEQPPSSYVQLSEDVRDAIVDALVGREVRFLPIEGAPFAPSDPRCGSGHTGVSSVRLALTPARAVHGDVMLVIAQTGDYCGRWIYTAARMLWQPGGLVGGDWVTGDVIGGAVNE